LVATPTFSDIHADVAQSGTAQAWKGMLDSLFPQGYPGSKQLFTSVKTWEKTQ
jgi:hypothetical protein